MTDTEPDAPEAGDYATLRDAPLVRAVSELMKTVHLETGAGKVPAQLAKQLPAVLQAAGAVDEMVAVTGEGVEKFNEGVLGEQI